MNTYFESRQAKRVNRIHEEERLGEACARSDKGPYFSLSDTLDSVESILGKV